MNLFIRVKNKKTLYPLFFTIIAFLGILFSYHYLFQTFFAMDEWSNYMHFLKLGPFNELRGEGLIGSLTGGIRVVGSASYDVYFYLFNLDIRPWHITFFALHLANTFLVYKLLRRFKLPQFSSFLAAFFFGIASAGEEAISWPAAGIQVLGTTLFILITIFLTLNYLTSKKTKTLVLAFIAAFMSYIFRPTGLVTPALILVLLFLFDKKISLKKIPKGVIILFFGAATIGVVRVVMMYWGKMDVLTKAVFDIFFFPLVTLTHVFISWPLMYKLGLGFVSLNYPRLLNDGLYLGTIAGFVVGDLLSVIGSSVILFFLYFLFNHSSKFNKKVLLFGLIVFCIQYLPIALNYPDRPGITYLESRHTYTSIIGISILLGLAFDFIIEKLKAKNLLKRCLLVLFLALVSVWFYKEMLVTQREVREQAFADIAIKKTFDNLQALQLPNSQKMVFYITSDRAYYSPTYNLPFKLPPAFMLPLAFYGRPFIDKEELGVLGDNNQYSNSGNKQFGYFTDITSLSMLIKEGKIDINNVVGFHFRDGSYTFVDITQQTRAQIENEIK